MCISHNNGALVYVYVYVLFVVVFGSMFVHTKQNLDMKKTYISCNGMAVECTGGVLVVYHYTPPY